MKKSLMIGVLALLLVLLFVPQALAADDTTPPALTGVSLNSTSFNRGDTMTVTVAATELESGFDLTRCSVDFLLKNPDEYEGCLDYFTMPLDTLCDGGVQGSIVLDERVGGTFELSGAVLTDIRGHVSTYAECYENLPELTFTLVSDYIKPPQPEKPVVTNLTLSPATAHVGETVRYTVTGYHSTGINAVTIVLSDPSSPWDELHVIPCVPVAGQQNTFSGSFTVPASMPDSLYYPDVEITANSGEYVSECCTGMIGTWGENRLRVINPAQPLLPQYPKFISYSISTHELTAGQAISVTIKIDPKYTMVRSIRAVFDHIATAVAYWDSICVDMYSEGNGVYSGTTVVPPTIHPGTYGIIGFGAWITNGNNIDFGGDRSSCTEVMGYGWYYTDSALTVKPPLSVAGTKNTSVLVGNTFDAMAGVSANNAFTGDITDKITVVGGDIDTSVPGIYLVKYIISDTITVEDIPYSVSYTDYRWIGVSELMPQGAGAPLVVTDGSINVGVSSSQASLTKDGNAIAFSNTLTSAGSYVISTRESASGTAGVAFSALDSGGHAIALDALDSRAVVTALSGSSAASASDTKSASLLIDREAPKTSLQCYVDSATSITVKANATDAAGISVTKWAKDQQSVSYFATGGTAFSDSFQANGYGRYTVYSRDLLGNESVTVVDVQAVGTPGAVQGSAAVNGSNAVSWNSVSGAGGYQVTRAATAGGTYTQLTETTSKRYTDTTAALGQTYYYKVRAYKVSGSARIYGTASTVSVKTSSPATAVTAAMTGYSSVKVSWNAVVGASGYQLYRATSQNGTYSLVKTTTSTSYTNTSLSTGRTYYYKVRAYGYLSGNKVYGNYSAIVSAKPMLSSVTTATASAYYPTSIKVSWNSVSGRTRYEVWRGTTPDTSKFTKIATTTSTSYKNTGLTPFVTYYYQIKVYRTVSGQKVYSSSASPTASARPILGNVTGVKAAMSSASSIKISWSSVTGASGYEVLRSTSPDSGFAVIKSTSSRSYTDSNRIPNTKYYYQVRAYRKVGSSRVYSTAMAASATPYFGAVTNPKAVRSSSTKIKISWSAVSGRTGYEIWRSTTPDPAGFTLLKSTTSTSYTNSGLPTGVTYYYKIRAYRTVNNTRYYSAFTPVVSAAP